MKDERKDEKQQEKFEEPEIIACSVDGDVLTVTPCTCRGQLVSS